jgi:hypothetical protein
MSDNQYLLALTAKLESAAELDGRMWMEIFAALIGEGAYVERSQFNGRWVIYQGVDRSGHQRCWEMGHHRTAWWHKAYRHVQALVGASLSVDSIDAALTLIPEGWRWSVVQQMDGRFLASATRPGDGWDALGVALRCPLAICIAALRARLSMRAENV